MCIENNVHSRGTRLVLTTLPSQVDKGAGRSHLASECELTDAAALVVVPDHDLKTATLMSVSGLVSMKLRGSRP